MQTKTAELSKAMAETVTSRDLAKEFGVSLQTIHSWRVNHQCPAIVLDSEARPAVRFVLEDVRAWKRLPDVFKVIMLDHERHFASVEPELDRLKAESIWDGKLDEQFTYLVNYFHPFVIQHDPVITLPQLARYMKVALVAGTFWPPKGK